MTGMLAAISSEATSWSQSIDLAQWLQPFTRGWWQQTVTSVLAATVLGALGCFVVLRRMALIGDALSHAVLPGVVVALLLTGSTGVPGLLLGALFAGLLTAVLVNLVSRHSRTKEDSAIGIVFTALFALGIILISSLPRGTHFDLKCFLFGDPLAVGREDFWMMIGIGAGVLAIIGLLYHALKLVSFDPVVAAAMGLPVAALHYLLMGMLSATVVAGLKATGVVLVVAMLITPASAAYQLSNRLGTMLLLSGLFGAVSAAIGMSLAFVTNSPTGPAMVVVATLIFGLAMLFSPSHGLVFDWLRRRRLSRHIAVEDLVRAVYKLEEASRTAGRRAATITEVAHEARLVPRRVRSLLRKPSVRELMRLQDGHLTLTEAGTHRAAEMVRAHRLWESYLADQTNLAPEFIHETAHRLEHAHEMADEVDAALGHPQRDPHGAAIPAPVQKPEQAADGSPTRKRRT
jgi:ABC-type Mn2+/Zn2+ transport system permease subunit/Mn-dependent DtxR family transcriptional regulator